MNAHRAPGPDGATPARLFILGSCVSRDAFGAHTDDRFQLVGYAARTAWGSAFADSGVAGIALDRINSPFQRRMVQLDIGKGVGPLLAASDADLILIDLIDERFDLFVDAAGAVCTVSPELMAAGFTPAGARGALVRSGSDAFYAHWEHGWRRLLSLLRQNNLLSRVRVNRVFWSTAHEDGSPFGQGQTPARIAVANHYLERLYQRLAEDLPARHFIDFPASLMRGALDHRWGSSPFHYIADFYHHMVNALAQVAESTVEPAAGRRLVAEPAHHPAHSLDHASAHQAAHTVLRLPPHALGATPQWHELRAPQGAVLRFEVQLQARQPAPDAGAWMTLECLGADGAPLAPAGYTLARSRELGYHRHLGAGGDGATETFQVALPIGFKSARLGLRQSAAHGELLLRDLRVTLLPRKARQQRPATILSVDVEALPGRAVTDSVERLVFGRFGDGQAVGITRLCDMFEQVGARATFFVDYSTCDIHGEKAIFSAAEMLKARGHDVQLHLHSEVLVRQRRWPHSDTGTPTFESLSVDVARACLEYGIERFRRNLGQAPRIFRPGGMRHSKKMVLAAKQAGIEAVSSLYRGRQDERFRLTRDEAVFRWDNGVLEAPLDYALDPMVGWGGHRREISTLLAHRAPRPLVSVLLHSTSLLFRALDGKPPHFTGYYPGYEQRLREYLAWFAQQGDFLTYSELLDSSRDVRTLALDDYYPQEDTGPADAVATDVKLDYAAVVEPQAAPAYDLTITVPAHASRQQQVLRLVPALQLPLTLAPGQRLEALTLGGEDGDIELTYILSGMKAYLMRQRCVVPGGDVLQRASEAIFRRHPRVILVLAQSVLEPEPVTGFSAREAGRRTYVLDLPARFEDYRRGCVSKKHRSDIERKERTVQEVLPGLHFSSLTGTTLDRASFAHAAELIESRLRHKTAGQGDAAQVFAADDALRQWEIYREHGEVVQLSNDDGVYATALCLHVGQDCFFMASGHLEAAPHHSLGNILLYRLIESLIARGVQRLHLGGGDFSYKGRYGATERQLYHFEFARPGSESLKSRLLTALADGASPSLLEHELGSSLETLLEGDFESVLGVDFNSVVENDVLGTDGQARRYQATLRDAFSMMMKHVPFNPVDTFVDIGCGKGKMLYYAAQLGYRRCLGVEIATMLLHQARHNMERLRLPAEIVLMHRDAGNIPLAELAAASLFYLYNPFSEGVMRDFVACLLRSQKENPRRITVVYCNALFDAPFVAARFYPAKVFVDGDDGWRFGHAVIYERDPD